MCLRCVMTDDVIPPSLCRDSFASVFPSGASERLIFISYLPSSAASSTVRWQTANETHVMSCVGAGRYTEKLRSSISRLIAGDNIRVPLIQPRNCKWQRCIIYISSRVLNCARQTFLAISAGQLAFPAHFRLFEFLSCAYSVAKFILAASVKNRSAVTFLYDDVSRE